MKEFWGYEEFRPSQEEIILSVLEGKDTLALLPTGGGKSLCFQVPGMVLDGICIVVSPLIALMKDQVENLQAKGIKAVAIVSGMHRAEIDLLLDNCIYGQTKFLYVSPERLQSELFLARLKKMKVNMIAVDEAHCISQWGYDFRPPYLSINLLRELLPTVPFLALTATATPEVVEDIQDKLGFKKHHVIRKSFERPNIAYMVLQEEDKAKRMLRIMAKVRGTGLVYVRNRRMTKDIAALLQQNKISADYYHAGLTQVERSRKQAEWKAGKTRVIVATNAFGMGIDKPDVRFVINYDLPDSLEAYFQEAGRAGRDEKKAYGVLLVNKNDMLQLQQNLQRSFPPIETIRKVYQGLANQLQVAIGAGLDTYYELDLVALSARISEKPNTVFRALSVLELDGYFSISQDANVPPKIHFTIAPDVLYNFQVANPSLDGLIKLLLRSYPGLFDGFVNINLKELAQRAKSTTEKMHEILKRLVALDVLNYTPQSKLPRITFTKPCQNAARLVLSAEVYKVRKERMEEKIAAVVKYANSTDTCRSVLLLRYFGDNKANECDHCDYCLRKKSGEFTEQDFDNLRQDIERKLVKKPHSLDDLVSDFGPIREKRVMEVLRWMVDHSIVKYDGPSTLKLARLDNLQPD